MLNSSCFAVTVDGL